jgi:hypothetical protein
MFISLISGSQSLNVGHICYSYCPVLPLLVLLGELFVRMGLAGSTINRKLSYYICIACILGNGESSYHLLYIIVPCLLTLLGGLKRLGLEESTYKQNT